MDLSRRRLLALGSAVGAARLIGAPGIARAQQPQWSYKYANNLPDTHPMNVRAREMASAIKAETDGRLDLQIFPSNQLGSDTDTLSQIRSGGVEFFTLSGLILSTLVPAASINGIGFAFPDYASVWKAMDGELGGYVRGQIAKTNQILAMETIWDNGFRQTTTSTKPITTPDDFRGMKLRVPVSPLWTSMFKALGASPASINFNEVYSALQTKIVDGQENPLAIISTAKLHEVQKYCSMTSHMWNGLQHLANRRAWEASPTTCVPSPPSTLTPLARRNVKMSPGSTPLCNRISRPRVWSSQARSGSIPRKLRAASFYTEWAKYGMKPGPSSRIGGQACVSAMARRETPSPADRSEGSGRALGRVIDLWLGSFIEILGSALVAAEIVILLAGVVSRYLFDHPLV